MTDKVTPSIQIGRRGLITRRFNFNSNGNNTLVTVASGERIKLYKAILTVSADITGEVILYVGSTAVGGIYNPKSGGQYCLMSAFPDHELGSDGEDLICNLPSGTAVTVNTNYELV